MHTMANLGNKYGYKPAGAMCYGFVGMPENRRCDPPSFPPSLSACLSLVTSLSLVSFLPHDLSPS